MSLIICEVSLSRPEHCVLTNITAQAAEGDNLAIGAPAGATFKIKNTKFYVPVVTLSTKDDNIFLRAIKYLIF